MCIAITTFYTIAHCEQVGLKYGNQLCSSYARYCRTERGWLLGDNATVGIWPGRSWCSCSLRSNPGWQRTIFTIIVRVFEDISPWNYFWLFITCHWFCGKRNNLGSTRFVVPLVKRSAAYQQNGLLKVKRRYKAALNVLALTVPPKAWLAGDLYTELCHRDRSARNTSSRATRLGSMLVFTCLVLLIILFSESIQTERSPVSPQGFTLSYFRSAHFERQSSMNC